MRVTQLILVLVLVLFSTCGRRQPDASSTARVGARANGSETPAVATEGEVAVHAGAPAAKVDFARQVKPILEAHCQPCHFAGGTMYQRLPFDQQKTITLLGTKLFTRIKDEKEKRLISTLLSQQSAAAVPLAAEKIK